MLSGTFFKGQDGQPHPLKAPLRCSISSFLSPSSVVIVSHLFMSVLTTPSFWCLGWSDGKFRYWSVCVFFLYTVDFMLPSSFLVNLVSKKGILFCSSSTLVKTMLPVGSTVFIRENVLHVLLQFLCLSCVNQADGVVHISSSFLVESPLVL